MQKLEFKVSSGLKNIIGKQLITDKYVAIFELVKNSYDASAENIEILYNGDEIIIADDGCGMNKDDILNKWLFVAYSDKENAVASDGRKYVGAKGVGRFACDRLGCKTEIITKKKDENIEHHLLIDWDLFEESRLKEFGSIPVDYYSIDAKSELSYTKVLIKDIRDIWTQKDIDEIEQLFYKLMDPFDNKYGVKITIDFNGFKQEIQNNLISNIKNVTIGINVKFSDFIDVELVDRGVIIYKLENIPNNTLLKNINMNLMYLNKAAKDKFMKIMKVRSVDYGSVFIYKNGFRIHPYGNPSSDFFELESRKGQGYARFISNRDIIGAISIVDDDNNFVEVSSRDRGFINNIYVEDLKTQYMEYVHRPLEKYVLAIQWGYDSTKNKEITVNDLQLQENSVLPSFLRKLKNKDYNLYVNSVIKEKVKPSVETRIKTILDENQDIDPVVADLLKESKDKLKKQQRENEEISNTKKKTERDNESLREQNSLLKNLTNYEAEKHAEITHHISKYSRELDSLIKYLYNAIGSETFSKEEIFKRLASVKNISNKMKVFHKIILKSNLNVKNNLPINILEYLDFYVNDIASFDVEETKIILTINKDNIKDEQWTFVCDPYDISVIVDNMYANAKELNATYLNIILEYANERKIIKFLSDTPHIPNELFDRIFELGYSTKKKGTGIGLYSIKMICNQLNWHLSVKNVEEGVCFEIGLN